MVKLPAVIAGCFLTIVLLTGCGATGGAPEAKPTVEPTASPTAVPTADPTEAPVNRFGLACASLVSQADIAAIYGEPLSLNPSDYFRPHATEAFIVDGALVCYWGEGTYIGAGAPYLEIIAGPSDGVLAEGSVASHEVSCYGGPTSVDSCVWNRITDKVWVSVDFHNLLENQVDSIQREPNGYDVTPRPGSDSELLVSRISDRLAVEPFEPVRASRGSLSPCDAIVDWSAIAAKLKLPQYSAGTSEALGFTWFKEAGIDPANRQSVRECSASFSDPSDVDHTNVTYISLTAVPGGEWVKHSGLRAGWAGEECTEWEGARICDLSVLVGSTAVIVSVDRVADEAPDGIGALVITSFVG
jgi:hypothetical protein